MDVSNESSKRSKTFTRNSALWRHFPISQTRRRMFETSSLWIWKDCQRELLRSTKTLKDVINFALTYERRKTAYKSYMGKPAASTPPSTSSKSQLGTCDGGRIFANSRERRTRKRTGGGTPKITTIGMPKTSRWFVSTLAQQRMRRINHAENKDISKGHAVVHVVELTIGEKGDVLGWHRKSKSTTRATKIWQVRATTNWFVGWTRILKDNTIRSVDRANRW